MFVEANLDTIESSNYLQSCTAKHFEDHIFSFLVVTDAFRALECLSHMNFECIFLHRELPSLSGVEALNILRTSKFDKGVVLVVNEGDSVSDEEVRLMGFDGVLRKPYSSLQLSEIIVSCSRHMLEDIPVDVKIKEYEI